MIYTNIYRTTDGELTDTAAEFAVGECYPTTIAEAKADVYKWLRFGTGEYITTLSNDGINHTPDMERFAVDITGLIDRAKEHEVDLPDDWRELHEAIEDRLATRRPVYRERYDEVSWEKRA